MLRCQWPRLDKLQPSRGTFLRLDKLLLKYGRVMAKLHLKGISVVARYSYLTSDQA